jgi:hypothetical protein
MVDRTIVIDQLDDGDFARWRVQGIDGKRKPFLTRYFDFLEGAQSFAEKLVGPNPIRQCASCHFAPCACGDENY